MAWVWWRLEWRVLARRNAVSPSTATMGRLPWRLVVLSTCCSRFGGGVPMAVCRGCDGRGVGEDKRCLLHSNVVRNGSPKSKEEIGSSVVTRRWRILEPRKVPKSKATQCALHQACTRHSTPPFTTASYRRSILPRRSRLERTCVARAAWSTPKSSSIIIFASPLLLPLASSPYEQQTWRTTRL